MEYIFIVALFVVGFFIFAIDSVASAFCGILVITIIAWLISLFFQLIKKFTPFKFFYTTFYVGRILTCITGVFFIIRAVLWML